MTTATKTKDARANGEESDMERFVDNWRTLVHVTTTRYPVGQTPSEVVWTLNKARLIRYLPTTPVENKHRKPLLLVFALMSRAYILDLRPGASFVEYMTNKGYDVYPVENKHRKPLLLVFALMSRAYILDLRPGASFVEYMTNKGYDVYLLDWGAPGHEDRDLKFDDYVLDYLPRAIRKLKELTGSDEFSMLGWCIGAILTTCYAALRPNDGLKNMVLLTAPLDFSQKDISGFSKWVAEDYLNVESVITAFGNMPPEMLDAGAKMLKPVENYISNYIRLLDNLDNPKIVDSWHAMDTWVNDPIPMPGGVFRQLVVDFFRGNRLVQGTLTMRGERVDLGNIKANLLNLIADADHITPPCHSENLLPAFGSQDKEMVRMKAGHIGIMLSSSANKITWPLIEGWLDKRD